MKAKKTKAAGTEKRRHERVPVGLSLGVVTKGQGVRRCLGVIADLSTGGMAFESDAVLEQGSSLYLRVNIPLEIRGEVRRVKPAGRGGHFRYGVRFHHFGLTSPESAKPKKFIAASFQKPRG
jgi:PilZ domain